MYTVTTKFRTYLNESHIQSTVADLIYNGSTIAKNMPVVDWQVSVDRSASNRRSATVTLGRPLKISDDIVTSIKNSTIDPNGVELKIWSGVVYDDGTEELVPLGIFPLETTGWNEATYNPMPTLQLFDRSKTIERARGVFPVDRSGFQVQALLSSLITDVVPPGVSVTVTFAAGLTNPRLPGGTTFDYERWDLVKLCADSMGADVYFDANGNVQVTPVPTLDQFTKGSDAVWTVTSGPGGNMISAARSVSRTNVYNGISVWGATPAEGQAQPYANVFDTDPSSSSYFYGPFGQSILRINNNLLTTNADCYNAAMAALKNSTGRSRTLALNCLPNPALDAGDLIKVTYVDGTAELHLADSISMGPKGMSIQTRTTNYQPLIGS